MKKILLLLSIGFSSCNSNTFNEKELKEKIDKENKQHAEVFYHTILRCKDENKIDSARILCIVFPKFYPNSEKDPEVKSILNKLPKK